MISLLSQEFNLMVKSITLEDVIKNKMKSAEFAKHFKHELLLNKIEIAKWKKSNLHAH